MKVLLKETISSLGIIGSEVEVADGYARNYLLPQGKAVNATISNINIMKKEKAKFDLQIAKEKELALEMAEQLKDVKCTLVSKVYEEDKLYGSVGVREIVGALEDQGVKVDKKMILLKEPIKKIGLFKVPVRIYAEIEPKITVEVVAE